MGSLDEVNKLEAYIEELGNEITKVKKASEYLYLIEKMQSEITQTSATLLQSKDQIKLYQEILESKLELYHTIAKNVEAKQSQLEQAQGSILEKITAFNKQFEALEASAESNKQELKNQMKDLQQQVSRNQEKVNLDFKNMSDQQNLHHITLLSINKFLKISLGITASLLVVVIILLSL
jgi:hypothetical protein